VESGTRVGSLLRWARKVSRFEEAFAAYVGMPHGIAVANGTDGLILALKAIGVEPGMR
jgi:dTDP-4-amino-4,6-dideoxygalactose transaminase